MNLLTKNNRFYNNLPFLEAFEEVLDLDVALDFIAFSDFPYSSESFSFIPKSFLFLHFHKNPNLLAKGCMLIRADNKSEEIEV